MLVLTRKTDERIFIGDSIVVTVLSAGHGKVRLGIEAPPELRILRDELLAHAIFERQTLAPAGLEVTNG